MSLTCTYMSKCTVLCADSSHMSFATYDSQTMSINNSGCQSLCTRCWTCRRFAPIQPKERRWCQWSALPARAKLAETFINGGGFVHVGMVVLEQEIETHQSVEQQQLCVCVCTVLMLPCLNLSSKDLYISACSSGLFVSGRPASQSVAARLILLIPFTPQRLTTC